jgi:hypothetical protein
VTDIGIDPRFPDGVFSEIRQEVVAAVVDSKGTTGDITGECIEMCGIRGVVAVFENVLCGHLFGVRGRRGNFDQPYRARSSFAATCNREVTTASQTPLFDLWITPDLSPSGMQKAAEFRGFRVF